MPDPIQKDRPDCPKELSDICFQMLQKKPEERQASAAEVCEQINAWLGTVDSSAVEQPKIVTFDSHSQHAGVAAEDLAFLGADSGTSGLRDGSGSGNRSGSSKSESESRSSVVLDAKTLSSADTEKGGSNSQTQGMIAQRRQLQQRSNKRMKGTWIVVLLIALGIAGAAALTSWVTSMDWTPTRDTSGVE